ncbi:hypothetical protein Clacol_005097 [Clathrus columnatus]|uniref:Uncharacterized protein n=1 Tax=Clathrus columnatus TaxID=1419009 RepID=A0AAV5ADS8_9AGAM|nr:hypothetical protein Clacol_005097 [Clathrus columnatus]
MNENKTAEKTNGHTDPRQTSILHRTPWIPPVAVSGKGLYITLEDGKVVLDVCRAGDVWHNVWTPDDIKPYEQVEV